MSVYRHLLWSTIVVFSSLATTISIALAEPIERTFTLNSDGNESFETLLQQAEDLVKTSIEQEFAENPNASEISITVLGETQGQIVPLLRSTVSRSQWQNNSRMARWTKYFVSSSGVLLGFYNPSPTPTTAQPQIETEQMRRMRIQNDPAFRDD
jgi:hypothetical protein